MDMIITQEELHRRLGEDDLVIMDCRFTLGQPNLGFSLYQQDHISGAFYLDLEKNLSGEVKEHGGRHPLPDLGEFALCLGKMGVTNRTWIVGYDDQGGTMASRLWWLVRFLGHSQVLVLDGGYQAWKAAGRPVSREIPDGRPQVFSPRVQRQMLASIDEVKSKLHIPEVAIIDSREINRYLGREEPIDRVAGHIPSAKHFFWKGILNPDGTWKSVNELQKHFSSLPPNQEIIVYCGSGVTACPNFMALQRAGFSQVKLYAGSWSDWISYPENPIEK